MITVQGLAGGNNGSNYAHLIAVWMELPYGIRDVILCVVEELEEVVAMSAWRDVMPLELMVVMDEDDVLDDSSDSDGF